MRDRDRPYRKLRAGVAATVVLATIALWAHGHLTGEPLGTLWDVVVLAFVLASGYAVYGEQTMDSAVETAQEMTDGADAGDEEVES